MPSEIISVPEDIRREVVGSLRCLFDSFPALFEHLHPNQQGQEARLYRSHVTLSDVLLPEADKPLPIVVLGDYSAKTRDMLAGYLQRRGLSFA